MSQAFSISARRRYGLVRVCTAWRVSRASVSRHLRAASQPGPPRRRPGPQGTPQGTMADTGLAARIRSLLAESPFHGEGYRKIWARLRHAGLRTSPRRVLRVMRENGLLAHQRTGSPRGP
jgi:putative transposase